MHEAGLIQGLVATAVAEAHRAGAHQVTTVTMRVADPRHTTPEAIQLHFALATRDTLLQEARLILTVAKRHCPFCKTVAQTDLDGCPACGLPLPPLDEPELALETIEWE